jgi:hypothetical protein
MMWREKFATILMKGAIAAFYALLLVLTALVWW